MLLKSKFLADVSFPLVILYMEVINVMSCSVKYFVRLKVYGLCKYSVLYLHYSLSCFLMGPLIALSAFFDCVRESCDELA